MTNDAIRARLTNLYRDRDVLRNRLGNWSGGWARYHELKARLRAITHEALRLETSLERPHS